ncbi:7666_t:CDS:1 [Acaulospora morrowiae]|uniref:7666_t:CDS:1 n=1 Tax=Acaulospora morrowiae TaxID=94023 RepID=A0A9N9AV16_9GLOM|nr:7666_t:CDS:1 [Acaulospora morrowiae]
MSQTKDSNVPEVTEEIETKENVNSKAPGETGDRQILRETFYFVELRKKFRKWEMLQSLSYMNLIITTIVCLASLVVGIFLYISSKNSQKSSARNILSACFSGAVSTFSLTGSLIALKSLTFKSKLDTINKLYAEEYELKITRNKDNWTQNLKKKQLNKLNHQEKEIYARLELYFMAKLVKHMRRMLIFRFMWAIIFSMILTALAALSVYTLLTDNNEDIFRIIDEFLIVVSSVFLVIILYIFFLTKIIIPRLVQELDDSQQFQDKIKIIDLFRSKKSKTFYLLLLLFGIQILVFSYFLGMILIRRFEIRRTKLTVSEMDSIIELLYVSGISKDDS